MIARLCAAAAAASLTILAGSTASWAGEKPDTSHREVCHPKAGGWVLINPAQASSHIDEQSGAPKHEHDGRVDVYAVNGACPTIPTTTPTGGTSSTPSNTTTGPSSTTTASPPAPAPSTSTTSVPSPSTNSSTPTRTSEGGGSSPSAPTGKSSSRPTSSPMHSARAQSPSPASTLPSVKSSPAASPETLAATGSSLDAAVVAAFLLTVGGLLIRASRRKGAHR